MKERQLTAKIVEWYEEHHRALPWRKTRDPYKIWLSEIILQQTRVIQGLPYYEEFIRRFPTVSTLAAAPEREILRIWQGLGYYSRARNLRKCAVEIVNRYGTKFPKTSAALKTLPGIGDYTAAAIASIAFDESVAVVDGNVFRVLARLFGIDDDIASTKGKKKFVEVANRLVPKNQPGLYNQAIMEFGALHCTPKKPKCDICTLQNQCVAYQQNTQSVLPVKRRPAKSAQRYFYYFVLRKGNRWMMKKRAERDIWLGLYDFPLHEGGSRMTRKQLEALLIKEGAPTPEEMKTLLISSSYKHVLSHQVIHARFIIVDRKGKWKSTPGKLFSTASWYSPRQMMELPKSVLVSQFMSDQGVL